MREVLARAGLAILAFTGAVAGGWALAAPRSFYDDFPGGGRHWVAVDGPYNEHLVRDFGSLSLAIALVVAVAAVVATPMLMRLAAGSVLVNGVPHLAYHAANLEPYGTSDKVGNIVSLSLVVVVALFVLLSTRARHSASTSSGSRRYASQWPWARNRQRTYEPT